MRVEGIGPLLRGLRRIDTDLPKQLQRAQKKHAERIVPVVRAAYVAKYQRRSGRGEASIRAVATQKAGGVRGGGARALYIPGQEWGSNRKKQFAPRAPEGRFIRPTVMRLMPRLRQLQLEALDDVLAQAYPRRGRR